MIIHVPVAEPTEVPPEEMYRWLCLSCAEREPGYCRAHKMPHCVRGERRYCPACATDAVMERRIAEISARCRRDLDPRDFQGLSGAAVAAYPDTDAEHAYSLLVGAIALAGHCSVETLLEGGCRRLRAELFAQYGIGTAETREHTLRH